MCSEAGSVVSLVVVVVVGGVMPRTDGSGVRGASCDEEPEVGLTSGLGAGSASVRRAVAVSRVCVLSDKVDVGATRELGERGTGEPWPTFMYVMLNDGLAGIASRLGGCDAAAAAGPCAAVSMSVWLGGG